MPYISGRNPVIEALRSGSKIKTIFLQKSARGKPVDLIRDLAKRSGVKVIVRDKEDLSALVPGERFQGVVALVPQKRRLGLHDLIGMTTGKDNPGFLLLPDQIEDPHNLGALIRSAECAGVHGVALIRHHSASLSPTAVKSSAGATEHIPIADISNLVNAIRVLKDHGYWIIGLDERGEKEFTDVDYTGPIAVVVGNEGKGIRRLVKEHCDFLVRIPLSGKISSLNASVAGALMLFEARRQRLG